VTISLVWTGIWAFAGPRAWTEFKRRMRLPGEPCMGAGGHGPGMNSGWFIQAPDQDNPGRF